MRASGILSLFDSPDESGNTITVTVSELRRSYGRVHDLSLESGEPVFITRDGEVDGVFFSMEAFKTLQNDLLLMLEDVVMKGRYLEDIISMHNGEAVPLRRRRIRSGRNWNSDRLQSRADAVV